MLSATNDMLLAQESDRPVQVLPRLVHLPIDEASWTDEDTVQRMCAGLLASGTSPEGHSDENLLFMNLLRQLSSLEVRILNYAAGTGPKYAGHHGLPMPGPFRRPTSEIGTIFGVGDLQRLDREFDHLRELGLGFGSGGGIALHGEKTDLTPIPLALHLYVRAQGSKLSPVAFWTFKAPGANADETAG